MAPGTWEVLLDLGYGIAELSPFLSRSQNPRNFLNDFTLESMHAVRAVRVLHRLPPLGNFLAVAAPPPPPQNKTKRTPGSR